MPMSRDRVATRRAPLLALGIAGLSLIAGQAQADPAVLAQFLNPGDPLNQVLKVSASEVVSLDINAAPGVDFRVAVPIEGQVFTLDLRPSSVRAPGFEVRAQQADGSWIVVDPGPSLTYRGSVMEIPGARVAVSLWEDGIEGQVVMPDGSAYWFEPLRGRAPIGGAGVHVVYRGADVQPNGGTCGVPDGPGDEGPARAGSPEGSGDCGGLCVAQLGCDADFEYYVDYGSSVTNVQNRINAVINTVNNQYESQCGIRHLITTILVRTAEPDPYSSTNYNTLLNQFRNEWLNNQGGIVRDVAHLFTGKNLDGSVIGVAYTIGGICTTSAYCLAESDCCGSFACATDLTAHELGHLWGASHCTSFCNSTMNSSITCVNTFQNSSPSSITAIVNHRNSRTCLDPGTPGDPPGPFNLLTPANGATNVPDGPFFDWSDSTDALNYTISADNNSDFSSPYFTLTVPTSQLQAQDNTFPQNTVIYWRVIANGNFGQTNSTPFPASFTTEGAPPAATVVYMCFTGNTSVPGLATVRDEDIVSYDTGTGTWAWVIDGSDLGLSAVTIDAFGLMSDGSFLLSFKQEADIPTVTGGPNGTLIDDSDIIRFVPTSLGSATAGTLSFYFDGSDVDLIENGEDIDSITLNSDGRMILGSTGNFSGTGASGKDEDLFIFSSTSLGANTAGTFALHFDGSDVGLSDGSAEDVDAAGRTSAGNYLLSTLGLFSVTGASGDDEDVFKFTPTTLGASTAGSYTGFLDLSAIGIATTADVNGVEFASGVGQVFSGPDDPGPTGDVPQARPVCPADINADDIVDSLDVNLVISGFGGTDPEADVDFDGDVDADDLNIVLGHWGQPCP